LSGALLIQFSEDAIDPAEAQRLLDRVVVLNARLAGILLVLNQPAFVFG